MKTGTAKYTSGGFKKKNHFKLKDVPIIARILPPIGNLADKGVWNRFYSVHFGYKNTEGKFRPFQSPLVVNNKTKMIEVPDAALERLDTLKAQLEKARAEGNGPLMARLNTLVGMKGVYNIDKNQHMNVILLDGTIGELKIRHKAFVKLKIEIEKLRAEGVDPLSLDNGRFFVFTKSAAGRDTTFDVVVYKEKIQVAGIGSVERPVVHQVTPEILSRLDSEAFDLDTLFTKPTSEEVAKIVATTDLLSGKSPAIDEFFDARWKAERTAKAQNDDGNTGPDDDDTAPVAATLAPTPAPVITPKAAPAPAPVAQAAAPKLTTGLTPQSQADAIDALSNDDFMKMIGIDPAQVSA